MKKRFWRACAALAAPLLLLVACSGAGPMVQPDAWPNPDATPPASGGGVAPGLEEFYSQQIDWSSCGQDLECGTVTVPIDYADPAGETLDLAVNKFALGNPARVVLTNPGGPGASGVELVEVTRQVFTSTLTAGAAIVGFDPRGVGGSSPLHCFDGPRLDEWYTTEFDVETDAGWDSLVAAMTERGEVCETNNPDLIGFMDSVSVARDMDIIRAALGQDTLDYLGMSYGTQLGAIYADLFGPNVGRFVLDGAVDMSLTQGELDLGQMGGFETAYRNYLADCIQGPGCPFRGSVDRAYEETIALAKQLEAFPMDSGDPDRPVTDSDLISAIIISMYSVDYWALLSSGLLALLDSADAGQIKFLADFAIQREPDGTYPKEDGAFSAVTCLDETLELDREASYAHADLMEEASPLFGPYASYGEVACATWPVRSGNVPTVRHGPDSPNIVVIGTTGDPATPVQWARALADQLDHSVLLTYEGNGHIAYGNGSCIDDAVDAFLLDAVLPADGLIC